MVFIVLNENKIKVFAHDSIKGRYKCIFCNKKIFLVNKSKNNKIAHFRNEKECIYSEIINKNYDFYTSNFHIKWT